VLCARWVASNSSDAGVRVVWVLPVTDAKYATSLALQVMRLLRLLQVLQVMRLLQVLRLLKVMPDASDASDAIFVNPPIVASVASHLVL
jgi:hypothetical protein